MTPEQEQNLVAQVLKKVLDVVQQGIGEAPKPTDNDSKRGKIGTTYMAGGAVLIAITMFSLPQFFPLAFTIFFVGLILTIVWHVDKSYFPEVDTFKKVGENPIAVALIFCAIVYAVCQGNEHGSTLLHIPADGSERDTVYKYIYIEKTIAPPAPGADTTGRGDNGKTEGQ